jgi:hypothetical protein
VRAFNLNPVGKIQPGEMHWEGAGGGGPGREEPSQGQQKPDTS